MAESSAQYHEPVNELNDKTRDMHRAIVTLGEEFEAIDWYRQRIEASKDKELIDILEHNMNEEKEHAAMTIEWIRRKDSKFSEKLSQYLFTKKPIVEIEDED